MLLLLLLLLPRLLLLLLLPAGEGGIIGLTVDVEDYDDQALFLATVRNATAATAAANLSLRFSATVPVWVAWAPVAGSDEGFHQQIMRAVDEVIIMDYGTAWYDPDTDSIRSALAVSQT